LIGGWLGLRAALDAAEMAEILPLSGMEPQPLLYRPNYPGGILINSYSNFVLGHHGEVLLGSAEVFSADDIDPDNGDL
jgi:hypothetical protein